MADAVVAVPYAIVVACAGGASLARETGRAPALACCYVKNCVLAAAPRLPLAHSALEVSELEEDAHEGDVGAYVDVAAFAYYDISFWEIYAAVELCCWVYCSARVKGDGRNIGDWIFKLYAVVYACPLYEPADVLVGDRVVDGECCICCVAVWMECGRSDLCIFDYDEYKRYKSENKGKSIEPG
jgi:hypothetical protein